MKVTEYSYGNARYCAGCRREHGPLYICPSYGPDLVARIKAEKDQFEAALRDGDYSVFRVDVYESPE